MANADEKAPEIDESGVKDGSGKEPETDSNKGSKELEKKFSEADVEAIFNRKFSQKMYALEKKYGMTLDELKAKADEPTIIKKLFHAARSDISFSCLYLINPFPNRSKR